jgi:predicted transcriptional regulator
MNKGENPILVQFLKVLADESRLRLLGLLADHEASVEELAASLNLRTPTVSHHLSRLSAMKLVDMRADGNVHVYRFRPESLYQLHQMLTPETLTQLNDDVQGDAWERKVLRDFLNGEELKEIPASLKKRAVVLHWLADKFTPGVRYPEAKVNEIIKHHHPDFATLRRELIGHRLMARENNVYWRLTPGDHLPDAP